MKTLYLMRHAKSDWSDVSLSDFDRPLNKRGEKNAPFMGEVLQKLGVKPQLLLSSPANRAKRTAKIIADSIGYGSENIQYRDSIYESSAFNLIMILKSLDENIDSCMLVGHNPSLTSVINKLSHFSLLNLPTAGVVAIRFDLRWCDIKNYTGEMLFYEYPKKHLQS